MYLGHEWFSLTIKEAGNDAVESLDVSLLQKISLAPLLGIEDVRTDKRIDFVGGIRGPEELERMVGFRRMDNGLFDVSNADERFIGCCRCE